ncbi:TlpA family protein disulfide reductase [Heyndrickxia ginsengihumi]|uniref:TlpA family protein disulfide reductase n=1 Tax=Heyndrickxia ginsengihumi TaxID=363870 RepID=UPI003D1F31C1
MIKRIVSLAIVFALIVIMIVQAIVKHEEHIKAEKTAEKKAKIEKSNKEIEAMYNQALLSDQDESPDLKVGTTAPDFSLKNLNNETIHLSDFKEKKVILNFWATWCPPCKKEMPLLEEVYKKYPSTVKIVSVNIDPQADVKRYIQNTGITFPVLLDENGDVNEVYNVMTVPTTYLINGQGEIKQIQQGQLTKDILKKWIQS